MLYVTPPNPFNGVTFAGPLTSSAPRSPTTPNLPPGIKPPFAKKPAKKSLTPDVALLKPPLMFPPMLLRLSLMPAVFAFTVLKMSVK